MKFLNLIATAMFINFFSISAHAELICTPQTQPSQWREASMTSLNGSAQALQQIRATGNFLTADLICSYDECVGFINGAKASGTIFEEQNQPLHFAIGLTAEQKPMVEFVCQPK